MKSLWKYTFDRRTRRLTVVWMAVLASVVGGLVIASRSGYFPAWFAIFLATVGLLYVLSIPRKIRLTSRALEIRCVIELTSIPLADISSIRRMEPGEMRGCFPLLGSYGFFGYYGWYYHLAEFSIFKVYCSQWRDFVRIDDIYETTYVVNCEQADELIARVMEAKKA